MNNSTLKSSLLIIEKRPRIGGHSIRVSIMILAISLVGPCGHAQTTSDDRKPITLGELQQMALSHNPTLAEAGAGIRAAASRAKQSALYPNPTVGYQGEQIRGGAFRGGEQGFFVQQDIVTPGKLGRSQKVFEQEQKETQVRGDQQKLRVMANVETSYIHALAAQQLLELRQDLGKVAQDAAETSHQLANVGQADAPDVLEAEIESERAALDVTMADENQRRIWRELAAVVGNPRLPLMRLEGNLEETPVVDADGLVERIVSESPAVKIAELEVAKSEARLAQAKRESIPDLQLRGGLEENRELLDPTGRPVGLQGFADAGVQIPIFNHNQGNVAASNAEIEQARNGLERVKLGLRERASGVAENYNYSRNAAARYKDEMIPRAQTAYEMYAKKYQEMAAPYPQVLMARRSMIQLQVAYVSALENWAISSAELQSYLLTDGLEAPAGPGAINQPARGMDMRLESDAGSKGR
jgi:cobalt-zinc-cadmium efflux system outer membrane protein